jgi:PAS domain S-box-containing protein
MKTFFNKNRKSVGVIGYIRDSKKRKVDEKVLSKECGSLKNILENMNDAFVSLDRKGRYTYVNSKAGELIGKNPKEIIGKIIWEVFPYVVGTAFQLKFEKVIDKKSFSQSEEYYPPFDKWFLNSMYPTENGIAMYFVDITDLKNIELELVKAKEKAEESDRLKSAFLANMSHEFRTPMNGILGFSSLLSEPGLGVEEQQEYIKLIQISGERMLNLISEIIDISKIESGMMEVSLDEVNVNRKIDFVFDLLKMDADEKSIQLICNRSAFSDFYIVTDRDKLYAILTNLVKNAIKYTNEGTIEFGYTVKNETLEFFVKDTGIGIPIDRQSAIFDRFVQVDIANIKARQGAGLGLAISKAFVELLGGEIWLESQEGIGSSFYFSLPFCTKDNSMHSERPRFEKPYKPEAVQLKTKLKILIADDDIISRKLIVKSVSEFGKEIIEATSGREVVIKFKENSDIDLILMDVQMPDMNGYEATKEIRELNRDVIIITQSAFALNGDREKALLAGSNDYITKPINKTELLIMLNKYFA